MARLVFMGTPEFAVPVLHALAERHQVAAVYTRADKPTGRGKRLAESPVKAFARERGLAIEQPQTLKNEAAQEQLRRYQPDVVVVAAYGLILPKAVIEIPAHGCINTHASLLPRWRGASPIAHAILAGDKETGITLMQMDAGLDTGPIIRVRALPIAEDDTTGTLTSKLAEVGAGLVSETLPQWIDGRLVAIPQPDTGVSLAPMIEKEDGQIDWTRSAGEIERAVRAFDPWPSAYSYWKPGPGAGAVLLKIRWASAENRTVNQPPGTVLQLDRRIGVGTGGGVLILQRVQLAGKREMPIEEFVKGQRRFVGSRLE